MSGPKYIDYRSRALSAVNMVISQCQSELNAVSTGYDNAEVNLSVITTAMESGALSKMHMQDTIEECDSDGVQAKLTGQVDYSTIELGDWKPMRAWNDVSSMKNVDSEGSEDGAQVRVAAHFEVPGWNGASLAVFEVTDPDGNTSAMLGVDELLLDEKGEWKNEEWKSQYEAFLSKTLRAQNMAKKAESGASTQKTDRVNTALQRAKLTTQRESRKGKTTHRVVTNQKKATQKNTKTHSVGG